MATYAYKDAMRKDIVYAANAVKEDRNKKFYCPNPNCTAHLYICAVDGSKKAYFRATKKDFPHVPMCSFGSSTDEFEADQFDDATFVFDNAMDNLCIVTDPQKVQKTAGNHNQGTVKKHPPRTLRQIYLMCKSKPVAETYGDKDIGSMILDDRSEYRYPKGCFGNRIIESFPKRKLYDNAKKQVYLSSPINSVKYSFILQFADEILYKDIRDEIYNNRDKIIVVAGKWEASGTYNRFVAEIISKKQIAIMK